MVLPFPRSFIVLKFRYKCYRNGGSCKLEMPNFKRIMRGYEPEAVTSAWNEMRQYLADLTAANKELKLQLMSVREQNSEFKNRLLNYEKTENDLRDALLSAQRIANQLKNEAEQKAEEILEAARDEVESILRNAQQTSEDKIAEADRLFIEKQKHIAQLDEQIEHLSTKEDEIRKLVVLASEHLDTIMDLFTARKSEIGETLDPVFMPTPID